MTWGKDAIKSHLFELGFHVSEVMFSDHQVTAHIEQDVTQPTLDAAFAHAQTIDIAMPIDRGDDNRVSTSFNGSINIFVLADHYAQINDSEAMVAKNAVQNFIAYCMAVRANNANHKCCFLHG